MMYWTALAWLSFIAAGIADWCSDPGTPARADAMFILIQGCFFMLCAIKERLTKKAT